MRYFREITRNFYIKEVLYIPIKKSTPLLWPNLRPTPEDHDLKSLEFTLTQSQLNFEKTIFEKYQEILNNSNFISLRRV